MKNKLRKYLSIERRDLWDGPTEYTFHHLSVDRLKHKLKHVSHKDRKMNLELKQALSWRKYKQI